MASLPAFWSKRRSGRHAQRTADSTLPFMSRLKVLPAGLVARQNQRLFHLYKLFEFMLRIDSNNLKYIDLVIIQISC